PTTRGVDGTSMHMICPWGPPITPITPSLALISKPSTFQLTGLTGLVTPFSTLGSLEPTRLLWNTARAFLLTDLYAWALLGTTLCLWTLSNQLKAKQAVPMDQQVDCSLTRLISKGIPLLGIIPFAILHVMVWQCGR